MQQLLERFIRYTKIDTQSDANSDKVPSSPKQLELIKLLKQELTAFDVEVNEDQYGYLNVLLKRNCDSKMPAIGFLAHVDTAPDFSGENVKAQIHENYQLQDIPFVTGETLSPKQFPELNDYKGKTLITTDGSTLLGCDDKAGVAIIMEMLTYFNDNPAVKHGDIYVAFTLDEEIGRGMDNFALDHFKPEFAYTIDGGPLGELNFETFNAAGLTVEFTGLSVHPGSAKDKMINAQELAMQFHSMLPRFEKPEHTEEYQGFFMLAHMEGNISQAKLSYIIRDHDTHFFNYRKQHAVKAIETLQNQYPKAEIRYQLNDQYYNMKEPVQAVPQCLDLAVVAYKDNGVEPNIIPIRGGTDGARLSFRGIPTPNIFTGGHNFHGKYEFTSLESMTKAKEIIISLVTEK